MIPPEYQPEVIKAGWVFPTFLVDGFVAGRWSVARGEANLEPFAPLPSAVRRELDDEARRLAAFLSA